MQTKALNKANAKVHFKVYRKKWKHRNGIQDEKLSEVSRGFGVSSPFLSHHVLQKKQATANEEENDKLWETNYIISVKQSYNIVYYSLQHSPVVYLCQTTNLPVAKLM